MASILKSSFLRLFTTGFVAGALAVVALQPGGGATALDAAPVAQTR